MRAKHERSISAYRTALDYAKQALKIIPSDVGSQFNVAFLQFQIAQEIIRLETNQRTLEEVNDAAEGLQAAVAALDIVAKAENPPFPRNDITSRANMGRNTMANQLERARTKQLTYENENASKLEQARKLREAEMLRREEEKRKAEEAALEKKRKILEEQEHIAARDRELMEMRGLDEQRRLDEDEDKEARKAERRARGPKGSGKRKKKSAAEDSATDGGLSDDDDDEHRSRRRRTSPSGTEGLSDEERPREKKKRKLQRKSEPAGKYKSAEFIDDDSDDVEVPAADIEKVATPAGDDSAGEGVTATSRSRKGRNVIDDEDEDEDEGIVAPKANGDVAMSDDDE